MYLRTEHAEHDIPTLRQFIRDNPLGIFTTAVKSPGHPLIQSTHIPWLLDISDEASPTELGTLRGHMARANPQTKAIIESLTSSAAGSSSSESSSSSSNGGPQLEEEVLILFNGPVHHYVTPKFYIETKPATGKVAPTWNYTAVQVYGTATVHFDAKAPATQAFLERQLDDLSLYSETRIMGYDEPWQVADAPVSYVEALKKAIVGLEIRVTSMAGKFKMSQERPLGDREGVLDGFGRLGTEVGAKMEEAISKRCAVADRKKAAKASE